MYSFRKLTPQAAGAGNTLPPHIVRLNHFYLSIGDDVYPWAGKGHKLAVQADPDNQAIKVTMASGSGYSINASSSARRIAVGKRLKELGMQIGDYKPHPTEQGVFVRSTKLEHVE